MVKPLPHINAKPWNKRAVLFDLDGVLVDGAPLHREALNLALVAVGGKAQDAVMEALLEGLPTAQKLKPLVQHGFCPAGQEDMLATTKQVITRRLMEERIHPEAAKVELVKALARDGYALGVVSNAIGPSVDRFLQLAGLTWPMSVVLSNQSVPRPKPHPDGWIIAMYEIGSKPEHTLIVEDSIPGIESAYASGAHVMEVAGPHEVTRDRVYAALEVAL